MLSDNPRCNNNIYNNNGIGHLSAKFAAWKPNYTQRRRSSTVLRVTFIGTRELLDVYISMICTAKCFFRPYRLRRKNERKWSFVFCFFFRYTFSLLSEIVCATVACRWRRRRRVYNITDVWSATSAAITNGPQRENKSESYEWKLFTYKIKRQTYVCNTCNGFQLCIII